jgi:hypothetical protein
MSRASIGIADAMRLGQRHAQRIGQRGAQHIASISISVFRMLTKERNLVGESLRSAEVGDSEVLSLDSFPDSRGARFAFCLSAALLTGCALEPQSVRVELDHTSHATQHEPFTAHPTGYGYDQAAVIAHWNARGAFVEIGEGVILERCVDDVCNGSFAGPREVFTGRVGYVFELKP